MMTIQPLLAEDAPALAAMRQTASAHKGEALGPEARPMFDAMFAATPAAADVRVEPATVGGIAGFWLRPVNARSGAHMLYIHGGGYVLGSAQSVIVNFIKGEQTYNRCQGAMENWRKYPSPQYAA